MIKPISLDNSLSSYRYPGRYGCYMHINSYDVEHALQDAKMMLQDDGDKVTIALLQYWDDRESVWENV